MDAAHEVADLLAAPPSPPRGRRRPSPRPPRSVVRRASRGPRRGWRPGRRGAAGRRRGGRARCAGARSRRCRRPRCGSSPAASPGPRGRCVGGRAEQGTGQRQLDAGDARPSPTGRRTRRPTTPTAAASHAPAAARELEEVELRRVAGQLVDVRPASAAIANDPAHAATVRAKPTAATGRRARWWAISFHRGADLTRSPSRRSQPVRRRAAAPGRRCVHVHQRVDP